MGSNKVDKKNERSVTRRNFLKGSTVLTGTALIAGIPGLRSEQPVNHAEKAQLVIDQPVEGELLYNGIRLPAEWPPRSMVPDSYDPMPVPYLRSPPEVLPIDIGRQLFV